MVEAYPAIGRYDRKLLNLITTEDNRYGQKWNRKETILAFDLYYRIPFRLTKRTTPAVIELANLIGRTPSSVARKLGNFGSFDPKLQEQGIRGLVNSSHFDARFGIRSNFKTNIGVVLPAENLAVVAGISEYARRIRELRTEEGYRIFTGVDDKDAEINLKANQYLMTDPEPDEQAARRWLVTNRIRKQPDGAKKRILQ